MSKKRARNDGLPGMPLVALCPVASDPMTPASVPSLRVKYQPLYLDRERKFKESKALFAFPISIDMVSESSVMTTFEDNMKQKSTTFEDNIKQKCDPGCNARKILEYVHNKPNALGRHSTVGKLKAQTKAAEFVRKSMVCVRSQPTLSADEASPLSRLQGNNNFVFVVAHCNRMHLYTTGDGEYVQVMLDPTLTSFVPKESLNPVSMSYSMFVKFWHPEEIEMIEKHFTRVNHISVAQLHRFVPVVPTHKQLDEFQAGVGPPTDLCQQSNSVLWWVDPKYKFGDRTSTAVAHQDTAPVVLQDKAQVALQDTAPVALQDKAPVALQDKAPVALQDKAPVPPCMPFLPLLPARAPECDSLPTITAVALQDTAYSVLSATLPLGEMIEFDGYFEC